MSSVQRYRDYLRERRIARLNREAIAHVSARRADAARAAMVRIRQQKTYQAHYYRKHRERIREEQKEWRNSLPGKRYAFSRLLRRVGITAFDWASAWEAQTGLCAGCLCPLDGAQNTHIDHCHTSGKFRGLLCSACNHALGKVSDSPETLRRLASYLEVELG